MKTYKRWQERLAGRCWAWGMHANNDSWHSLLHNKEVCVCRTATQLLNESYCKYRTTSRLLRTGRIKMAPTMKNAHVIQNLGSFNIYYLNVKHMHRKKFNRITTSTKQKSIFDISKNSPLLWSQKIHYRVHKSPMNSILSQLNPGNPTPYFFKIYFNIIFQYMAKCPNRWHPLGVSD